MSANEITVRSVLGDERTARIKFPESDHPWFECPFGFHAVYVSAPSPAHPDFESRDGVCRNPWCIANPAFPVDAARVARGEEMLRLMEEESRSRNHRLALERIAGDRLREAETARQREDEARDLDKCVRCAVRLGKLVKHRKTCPLQKV